MKKSLSILFLFSSVLLFAQKFDIPAENEPFYQVLEWKGLGTLLLSRDASLQQKQVKITMVAAEGKSTWQQVFNPMSDNTFFISEDKGRYAYFLENLELNSGKVYLHQVSAAGNIKVKNLSFVSEFKQLGAINSDDVRLVDIITTEKALVWLFTYSEKAKNKITTIAISMTHHNFMLYSIVVSENVSASSKIEDQISWYVAGENGENIVFAARSHAAKDAGWKVKEINPKGVTVAEQTIGSGGLKYNVSQVRVGFGRRGSALLKRSEPDEKGSIVYANGKFYVGGISMVDAKYEFVTYVFGDDLNWKETAREKLDGINPKKDIEVGFMQLQEGIAWFVGSTQKQGLLQGFSGSSMIKSTAIEQDTYNPSKLLTSKFPNTFVCSLADRWLLFDSKQLPKKGSLTLEYIVK